MSAMKYTAFSLTLLLAAADASCVIPTEPPTISPGPTTQDCSYLTTSSTSNSDSIIPTLFDSETPAPTKAPVTTAPTAK